MLPIGPHGRPEPAEDLNYWYPRHVNYSEELAVERIQSRKAFIWTLRCDGASAQIIESFEEELATPPEQVSKEKDEFGPWWLGLEAHLRTMLMERYEQGLLKVLEKNAGTTQGALRKSMKKRREEE
jgi:hypothetical protein